MVWALSQLAPEAPPPRAWLDAMLASALAVGDATAPREVAMLLGALARWRLTRARGG